MEPTKRSSPSITELYENKEEEEEDEENRLFSVRKRVCAARGGTKSRRDQGECRGRKLDQATIAAISAPSESSRRHLSAEEEARSHGAAIVAHL